jgi:hypothetical protein
MGFCTKRLLDGQQRLMRGGTLPPLPAPDALVAHPRIPSKTPQDGNMLASH